MAALPLDVQSCSFPPSLSPSLPPSLPPGIRVVANAGGVNLQACAQALRKLAADEGVQLSVATVTGDDLMNKVSLGNCQVIRTMAI